MKVIKILEISQVIFFTLAALDGNVRKCFASKDDYSKRLTLIIGTICSTFHWVPTAICTVVVPLIVLSLHQLCQKGSCKLAVPQLSRKWESYWHLQSFGAMFLFFNLVRLMAFLPVGNLVKAASGATVRMNGFATLLAFLACVPALVFRKVDVSFATKNYYHLMTSTLLCSVLSAAGAYVKSRWAKKSALNPKVSYLLNTIQGVPCPCGLGFVDLDLGCSAILLRQ